MTLAPSKCRNQLKPLFMPYLPFFFILDPQFYFVFCHICRRLLFFFIKKANNHNKEPTTRDVVVVVQVVVVHLATEFWLSSRTSANCPEEAGFHRSHLLSIWVSVSGFRSWVSGLGSLEYSVLWVLGSGSGSGLGSGFWALGSGFWFSRSFGSR